MRPHHLVTTAAAALALAVGLGAPADAAGAPLPGDPSLNRTLTSGVTVGAKCAVTGFTGVLPNKAGTQCNQAGLAASASGLTITSSAGQLANGNQQDALYNSFDAGRGTGFLIHTRITGPVRQLTANYQQIGLWFGPDTNNFVKVEAEHNGTGTDPHLTMFWDENGVAKILTTVSVPAITTTTTLDLFIRASSADQLTVFYSLNGGSTKVQVGTARKPAAASAWFSSSAKAGILDSNSGTRTTLKATFTKFQITPS